MCFTSVQPRVETVKRIMDDESQQQQQQPPTLARAVGSRAKETMNYYCGLLLPAERPRDSSRRGQQHILRLSLLFLVAFGQISAVSALGERQVSSAGRKVEEVQEIQQLGSWDALSLCIRDSKEERALERWLLCVETVSSSGSSGISLHGRGSAAIGLTNEVSSVYEGFSTLEKIKSQAGFLRAGVDLDRPHQQLESVKSSEIDISQLQKVNGREDGSQDGGSGSMKMGDSSWGEVMSSYGSIEKRVGDSGEFDSGILKESCDGGFITGPPINDGSNDRSAGQTEEDFLFYRGDQNKGSASGSTDDVDQIPSDFRTRQVEDEVRQSTENAISDANSVTPGSSNGSRLDFLSSQEGRIEEGENILNTFQEHTLSSVGMRNAITSVAVVGLLSLMLRARHRGGGGKSENLPEMSTARSKSTVESNAVYLEPKLPADTQKLSQPLGMAVAHVLYEVLEQNGDYSEGSLSAETLSNLLESALKESLTPVLGNDRFHFVENFRDSFSSTYRTRATVHSVYKRAGVRYTEARQVGGKSWRGPQPRSRREPHKEQYTVNVERRSDVSGFTKRSMKFGYAHKTRMIPVQDEENKESITRFFSTTKHEQDGKSGFGESTTGLYLGSNSPSEKSQLAPCNQEPETPFVREDSSQDEQMYSANDSSGGNEEWILLERRGSTPEAKERKESTVETDSDRCHSLECAESAEDQTCTTGGVVGMLHNTEASNSPDGGVGSSRHTGGEGGLLSSQGMGTPRLDLYDQTLDTEIHVDLTCAAGLNEGLESPANGFTGDNLLQSGKPQVKILTASADSEASSLRTPERRGEGLFRRRVSAGRGDDSDRVMPPQARASVSQSSGLTVQDALVLASSANVVGFRAAVDERYDLLERSVAAQEHHNRLLAWDLQRRSQGLAIKQEHLHLQFESNTLMKENVELSRIRAEFKENELQDRKLNLAYDEFSRTCADQLVAGLCVMLAVLGFCFWKFSYNRLSGVVTVCTPPVREHHESGWLGTNWMFNSLNALTYTMQAFTCEVTKVARMALGLVVIALVTSSLLRRSVTSSSQAMPATIIVIVLGGICGLAGKVSIDTLGGSGLHWLVLWECLCFLHAFATCFTPLLYHLLNGPPARNCFEKAPLASRISSAVSRFIFHTILVFALPLMTGLLPFASPEEIMQMFLDWWSPGTFHGKYRHHS